VHPVDGTPNTEVAPLKQLVATGYRVEQFLVDEDDEEDDEDDDEEDDEEDDEDDDEDDEDEEDGVVDTGKH